MKSLERAIDILFSFTGEHTTRSPAEIAAAVGIPVSSVYRFLKTFESRGLVDLDRKTGTYSLGYDVLMLESAVRKKIGLEKITKPVLDQVAGITRETVQITILNKDHGFLLFAEESPTPPRFAPDFGFPMPLYAGCTVQVIMAYLPEEARERIISGGLKKFGPRSILSPEVLRTRLDEIRDKGYAISFEEFYPGSKGIAFPFFRSEGRIVGSLAVSAPIERFDSEKERQVIDLLFEESKQITKKITAQDSYNPDTII